MLSICFIDWRFSLLPFVVCSLVRFLHLTLTERKLCHCGDDLIYDGILVFYRFLVLICSAFVVVLRGAVCFSHCTLNITRHRLHRLYCFAVFVC